MTRCASLSLLAWSVVASSTAAPAPTRQDVAAARTNAATAQQAFQHAASYLRGWSAKRIPPTGLIPKNDDYLVWEPKNSAADNYVFMVLTSDLLDPVAFQGPMLDMLNSEKHVTSRVSRQESRRSCRTISTSRPTSSISPSRTCSASPTAPLSTPKTD